MTTFQQVPLLVRNVWPRTPLFTVITDPADWPALDVDEPAPDLDWATQAAVVVVLGWRPNLGYGLTVTCEQTAPRELLVTVQEIAPDSADVPQAIGCPARMVIVPNSESLFTFRVPAPIAR